MTPPKLTTPETIDVTTLHAAVPEIWLVSNVHQNLNGSRELNHAPFRDGLPSTG